MTDLFRTLFVISIFSVSINSFGKTFSPPKGFTCPTQAQSRSVEEMYQVMHPGSVWGRWASTDIFSMVFTGENEATSKLRGLFRVGYRSAAADCDRQILLENEKAGEPGVYEGWLAVDICNKTIKSIIDSPEVITFRDAQQKILATLGPTQAQRFTITNPNVVEYDFDSNGKILPRFRVRITSFYFEEETMAGENAAGNEFDLDVCEMNVELDGNDDEYLGVSFAYTWEFGYERSPEFKATTLISDDNGKLIPFKKYSNKNWF